MASAGYIRRETAISIVINVAISLALFVLIFGRSEAIAVWGPGNYAFDLIPQSFMVALMSVLVPGALAARKLRAQQVEHSLARSRLPANRVVRALVLAGSAAASILVIVWPLLAFSAIEQIGWWPALISKLAIGGLVAAAVTPVGLRVELAR